MSNKKFYICEKCGNLVEKVEDSGVSIVCCGAPMKELVPNTVDASGEKHLPVYTYKDNILEVSVGSVIHPMEEKHYISFIYVETKKGSQRKSLEIGKEPKATFSLVDDEPVNVFAYCNLHGLWKSEVK